jgi:TipAS antibiotic-recognition domain
MNEYDQEVQERWGDTDAYRESQAKTSKYSKDDFQAAKVDQEAATELFVYAFGNSLPIDSPKTQEAVRAQRCNYQMVLRLFSRDAKESCCYVCRRSTI